MALIDDLVSYWKLDESSGTRADAHGTNDLTDNNTVTSAVGKIGTAADFDSGSSESLSRVSNSSLQVGDIDFSIAFWIQAETLATFPVVIRKGDNGIFTEEYVIYYDTSANRLKWEVCSGAAIAVTVTYGSAFSTGTWYHVVCWHDASNNQIGLAVNDGTPVTLSHSDGVRAASGLFEVGARSVQGLYWNGLIDEIGFWKRVLSSQDRTDLYGGGAGLSYPFGGGGIPTIYIYPASLLF